MRSTGILYLACSSPYRRSAWTPALGRLNSIGAGQDYVATYDHVTSRITHLTVTNFTDSRGLSLHGMDVVPSSSDPNQLFIFLINHRPPLNGLSASHVGADSVVEIFRTTVGSDTITHLSTVADPIIHTPNDLVGSPDANSFYFTNDHGEKVGLWRSLDVFGRRVSSVGYCHIHRGCQRVVSHMHGNNGIAKSENGTIYVGNAIHGIITIFESQTDNSLVLLDVISLDRGVDNLSLDSNGVLWAAGFPSALIFFLRHANNPSESSPSSAHAITINTGSASFYGQKYKVEKLFEDDGAVASGITSAVHDPERHLLFLHGLASPRLAVCRLT